MGTSEEEVFERCRERYAVIQIGVVSSGTRDPGHATSGVETLCYQLTKQPRQLRISNLAFARRAGRDLLGRHKGRCGMHDRHVEWVRVQKGGGGVILCHEMSPAYKSYPKLSDVRRFRSRA